MFKAYSARTSKIDQSSQKGVKPADSNMHDPCSTYTAQQKFSTDK